MIDEIALGKCRENERLRSLASAAATHIVSQARVRKIWPLCYGESRVGPGQRSHEPRGEFAGIMPWNFPVLMAK